MEGEGKGAKEKGRKGRGRKRECVSETVTRGVIFKLQIWLGGPNHAIQVTGREKCPFQAPKTTWLG